jgi:hypothetical protein
MSMKQSTKCLEDTSCFRLINPICKTYFQNTTNKMQALANVQLFTSKYFAKNIDYNNNWTDWYSGVSTGQNSALVLSQVNAAIINGANINAIDSGYVINYQYMTGGTPLIYGW